MTPDLSWRFVRSTGGGVSVAWLPGDREYTIQPMPAGGFAVTYQRPVEGGRFDFDVLDGRFATRAAAKRFAAKHEASLRQEARR